MIFTNFLEKSFALQSTYVLKQILTNYKWLKGHYLEFLTRYFPFIFEIVNYTMVVKISDAITLYFQTGEKKLFLFVVDQEDVNYLAVSSNVAIEGTRGGPERY